MKTKEEILADQKLYLYTVVNINCTLIGRGYDADNAKLLAYQYADAMMNDEENAGRILFDLLNDKIAWKAYEEVHFSPDLILRWVREGDFYVSRIDKELMEKLKNTVGGDKNENQRGN